MESNIVLIGMPACGKSTVGRLIAELSGMPLIDTDTFFSERMKKSPASYLSKNSESHFRDAESRIIAEISTLEGYVISTGGGAVLRPDNVRFLKYNGILFFIDRSLDNIKPSPKRPLTSDPEALARVYEERRPVYLSCADYIVNGNVAVEDIAHNILELFNNHLR